MDIREFSEFMEKYRRGELSSQERELLEHFFDSFQDNHGEWDESRMGNQKIVEEEIFSEVKKNIAREKILRVSRMFFSSSASRRAAAIILFFILSSGILYLAGAFHGKTYPVVWSEKSTSAGEKCILDLPDGSNVTLNADSKLTYPNRFDGTKREVYLAGEGYFVVHHDDSQPFIVHARNLSTTVLGTRFDISAYPESKTISVSLLEGKIKVSSVEQEKTKRAVVLEPKEQLLYNEDNGASSFGPFDSLKTIGWKDNIYEFENEPMRTVLPQLERAFGTKLIMTDQKVLGQKITIKFENSSEATVIDVIKSLTGLEYSIVSEENGKQEVRFFRSAK